MTPKPSEAELAAIVKHIRERIIDCDGASPAFLELRVLPALHGLLARIRELEADLAVMRELQDPNAWEKAATDAFRVQAHNTDLRARAEDAEKRAGELTAERDAERMTRESLERRVVELESYAAGLAGTVDQLRAMPAAAAREALVELYDAAMLSHGCMLAMCRHACPSHLPGLTKALAAAREALPELTGKEGL